MNKDEKFEGTSTGKSNKLSNKISKKKINSEQDKVKKRALRKAQGAESRVLEPEVIEPEVIEPEVIDLENADKADSVQVDVSKLIPALKEDYDLSLPVPTKGVDPLLLYIRQISRYSLLSIEQERALVHILEETGDIEVAKKLVVANLRLVVKIAMEYRSTYQNVMDLIQEGNIGLMKAVSKYDSSKGAKLSYYSSWWIRSYILKYILDNFHLVKIGTTNEQKKLFYNLLKEKNRLLSLGIQPDVKLIFQNLGVSEKAVTVMDQRLGLTGGEVSIDKPLFQDSETSSLSDILASDDQSIEDRLAHAQGIEILKDNLGEFLKSLKERDQEIFKKRLLSEVPPSLQAIADDYGVSRERIRQIEERLLRNLKVYMSKLIR